METRFIETVNGPGYIVTTEQNNYFIDAENELFLMLPHNVAKKNVVDLLMARYKKPFGKITIQHGIKNEYALYSGEEESAYTSVMLTGYEPEKLRFAPCWNCEGELQGAVVDGEYGPKVISLRALFTYSTIDSQIRIFEGSEAGQ